MDKERCRDCEYFIYREWDRKVGRRNIYVDEFGNRWNGMQCPTCFKEEKRDNYHASKKLQERRELREIRKNYWDI